MNAKGHIQNSQMLIRRADGDYGNQLMALVGIADALIAIAMVLDEMNEREKVDIKVDEIIKEANATNLPPFNPMTLTDIEGR